MVSWRRRRRRSSRRERAHSHSDIMCPPEREAPVPGRSSDHAGMPATMRAARDRSLVRPLLDRVRITGHSARVLDRGSRVMAVALAIGLRRGEALGLRWIDADPVNGRVVITKALSRVGTNLALRDVKTESSAASVPLPGELVAILRRHRRDQFGDTQVARANKLGLVFTTENGTPLEPRNVNRAFESAVPTSGCAQHPAARPSAFVCHVVVRDGCRGSNGAAHSAS